MALQPFVGPWPLYQFLHPIHIGRTPWTKISPSQGIYLHAEQHKHRINAYNTDIHALSGIRTHDSRDRASENFPCLRKRGHFDRQNARYINKNLKPWPYPDCPDCRPVICFREYGNKYPGSIKARKFLDRLSNCRLKDYILGYINDRVS
jgi:hypothetical protein